MKISDEALISYLNWPDLIEALRTGFKVGCEVPERHHHRMEVPGEVDATMLLMPAWQVGGRIGVKLVNVFPGNSDRRLPSISSDYLLYDGKTGRGLANMNGNILTARRTAAAAALATDYLSRPSSRVLFLVGAGRVASLVPEAIRTVREIEQVLIWDLRSSGAERLCEQLRQLGFQAKVELDLRAGTEAADIISCATLATDPLIKGAWLKPGQHLDLIGSFTPAMRETDDEAMLKAEVFVDVPTALHESGDLIEPLKSGALSETMIRGDLGSLCRETAKGRDAQGSITLFKAVGTALEDLAAASLAYDRHNASTAGSH